MPDRVGIVVGIVCEIFFLMSTAVRSAVMVSQAVDLRLVPLNAERAFVAKMLVRAAFEIGACIRQTSPRYSASEFVEPVENHLGMNEYDRLVHPTGRFV